MDDSTLERNARIRKIENDDEVCEPESKKLAGVIDDADIEPLLTLIDLLCDDEVTMDVSKSYENSEADGSTTSADICYIEQLPPEVLNIIFAELNKSPRRHTFRLVCKAWYNAFNRNEEIVLGKTVRHIHLENCGLKEIDVYFTKVDIDRLPETMWKKIGNEISRLDLGTKNKLGDQGFKNIIMYCNNLKTIRAILSEDIICSVDMLRELNFVHKNLEVLDVVNYDHENVDILKWIQFFEASFKVFPRLRHYCAGNVNVTGTNELFRLGFSKESFYSDSTGIASSLAFSLSIDNGLHHQALDTCSTPSFCSLDNVSLKWKKIQYEDKDQTEIVKFFSIHTKLVFINIELGKNAPKEMLKTVFFQILEHCSNLRALTYCKDIPVDWLHTLSKTEFAYFLTKSSQISELEVNNLNFLIRRSSLTAILEPRTFEPLWEPRLMGFVQSCTDLQHLNIDCFPSTDGMLQNIFHYLTNLKTLSIRVTTFSTNRGITGHHGDVPGVCKGRAIINLHFAIMWNFEMTNFGSNYLEQSTTGYSINRLKNLEQLKFIGYRFSQMDDSIFYEFDFPKLRYLETDSPDEPTKLLPIMAKNMPLLEKICFSSQIPDYENRLDFVRMEKSLVSFCRFTKKLHTIILKKTSPEQQESTWCTIEDKFQKTPFKRQLDKVCLALRFTGGWKKSNAYYESISMTENSEMLQNDIIDIFKVCPSLRFIEGYGLEHSYYDPITRTIVLYDKDEIQSKFVI